VEVGTYVVADSTHGVSVGRVVIAPEQVITNEGTLSELRPLVRIASQEDLEKWETMKEKAQDALRRAKAKAADQSLNMTISTGEFDLGGGQFTAYFTTPERVDFRSLVRELSRELGARVQLLQVGDRDRAKLADGIDICGERLCCSSWMTNFPSVSIRMAKEQDLPLNPQKISGVCGRLFCCLTFEYEDYRALRGTLPKVGALLSTPAGEAKVTGIDFNREVVRLVLTESGTPVEVAAIDFKLQNGVAIRPMELVHKIEGPLRQIGEARESVPTRLPARQAPPRQRPARGEPPARPTAERPAAEQARQAPPGREGAQPGEGQRRRRRRRGRGGRSRGGGEGQAPGTAGA
jgi:cell fate regulator YaaT (PSP1 superfamily)